MFIFLFLFLVVGVTSQSSHFYSYRKFWDERQLSTPFSIGRSYNNEFLDDYRGSLSGLTQFPIIDSEGSFYYLNTTDWFVRYSRSFELLESIYIEGNPLSLTTIEKNNTITHIITVMNTTFPLLSCSLWSYDMNTFTASQRVLFPGSCTPARAVVYTPSSDHLITLFNSNTMYLYNFSSETAVPQTFAVGTSYRNPTWYTSTNPVKYEPHILSAFYFDNIHFFWPFSSGTTLYNTSTKVARYLTPNNNPSNNVGMSYLADPFNFRFVQMSGANFGRSIMYMSGGLLSPQPFSSSCYNQFYVGRSFFGSFCGNTVDIRNFQSQSSTYISTTLSSQVPTRDTYFTTFGHNFNESTPTLEILIPVRPRVGEAASIMFYDMVANYGRLAFLPTEFTGNYSAAVVYRDTIGVFTSFRGGNATAHFFGHQVLPSPSPSPSFSSTSSSTPTPSSSSSYGSSPSMSPSVSASISFSSTPTPSPAPPSPTRTALPSASSSSAAVPGSTTGSGTNTATASPPRDGTTIIYNNGGSSVGTTVAIVVVLVVVVFAAVFVWRQRARTLKNKRLMAVGEDALGSVPVVIPSGASRHGSADAFVISRAVPPPKHSRGVANW